MNDEKKPENKANNNLPSVQVERVIQDSVKDILTPAQVKQVTERLRPKLESMVISISKYHSGPLPSVDTVEGYERVEPGSFRRILAMAELDQSAVINSTKYKTRHDSIFRILCLLAGLFALGAILIAIVYLAMNNHDNAAIGVSALGAAGIIGAFVNARYSKE
jgi:uncharacterized membrane protein